MTTIFVTLHLELHHPAECSRQFHYVTIELVLVQTSRDWKTPEAYLH